MRVPDLRRRRDLGDFGGPGREPLFPGGDQRAQSRIARDALLGGGALGAGQHAEGIFGGEQFVLGQARYGRCVSLIAPDKPSV